MADAPGKRTNLTMQAYERIRGAILSNRLQPGHTISGSSLAKYLGMSRTPIREALQILENEGLVETQNGVGFFVRGITYEELREISEVRSALECTALRNAAGCVPAGQLEELLSRWAALETPEAAADPRWLDNIVRLDRETHRLIVENGGNAYLSGIIAGIDTKVQRIQHLSVDRDNAADTVRQHVEILRKLREGDTEAACALLDAHIRYSATYISREELEQDQENAFLKDVFS